MGRALEFANFPRDGLWYIRWVETIHRTDSGVIRDRLQVMLCRVPADASSFPSLGSVRGSVGTPQPIEVPVDTLPALRIGSIWQRGACIGRMEAEERAFTFELPRAFYSNSHGMHGVGTDLPISGTNGSNSSEPALSKFYPTGTDKRSTGTVLADGDTLLFIPASEVLRTFIAPSQKLITTLTSGPWSQTRFMLIQRTTAIRDNAWHVDLCEGISASDALFLANLQHAFNPRGFDAAKRVFMGFSDGHLIGMLPFDSGTLSITARVLEFRPNRYLCVEILRVGWPRKDQPPVIVHGGVEIDASASLTDQDRHPATLVPASVQVGMLPLPPMLSAGTVSVNLPGPRWDDLPEVERRPMRTISLTNNHTHRTDSAGTCVAATGEAGQGPGSQRLKVHARGTASLNALDAIPRFEAVRSCLASLQKQDRVSLPENIASTDTRWSSKRGDLEVWAFELKVVKDTSEVAQTWALIIQGNRARARSMLIYRFEVGRNFVFTWFELEADESKGSKALIVRQPLGEPTLPYEGIFQWTRARRGLKNLSGCPSMSGCDWRLYKHRYIRDPEDFAFNLRLDAEGFWNWLANWDARRIP